MADSISERKNPFVGPRAIRTGERLYGRDRETSKLFNLLIAERIVLLYSPSGAGKTSLVQAALIPRLESRNFTVLPVARVNLEPDPALTEIDGFNRYVYSVIASMEEQRPDTEQLDEVALAGMSLPEYLDERTESPAVILFDQFEEVLTVDPTDQEEKVQFFEQVGEALISRSRWALFSMREDYIAGLDPYLLPIPTRLSTTFRLDLLTKKASREVIQQLSALGDVDFTEDAATKLIDDLCRVQVQRPDGSVEIQIGQYVEPVQMQVVCYSLWEKLDPEDKDITIDDVAKIGDVDESLAEYYCRQINEVSKQTGVKERAIREWFDVALITESGIRGQVLMGQESSDGLQNDAIHRLVNAHLVRRDTRRGTTWFELAHDRLIGPVRRDNATWFQANLSLLQRLAALWKKENRGDHLLLRESSLEEAEEWAAANPGDLTPTESEFLKASQEARQREIEERERQEQAVIIQEQERLAKKLRRFLTFAVVAAIAAGIMAVIAFMLFQRADLTSQENASLAAENATVASIAQVKSTQAVGNAKTAEANAQLASSAEKTAVADREIANQTRATAEIAQATSDAYSQLVEDESYSRALAAQAHVYKSSQPELSSLLSIEAYKTFRTREAINMLLTGLQQKLDQTVDVFGRPIPKQTNDNTVVAVSPDGERMAWGDADGSVVIWNYKRGEIERRLTRHGAPVFGLAFSPDGKYLVSGGDDVQAYVWDVETGASNALPDVINFVKSIAFSPDGNYIAEAVGSQISIWDFSTREKVRDLRGHGDFIFEIDWSPDGSMLASAGADQQVIVWNPDNPNPVLKLDGHEDQVYTVVFSADSKELATGGRDRTFILWDIETGEEVQEFIGAHGESSIYSLAFSPDGNVLASAGGDGTILFTDVNSLQVVNRVDDRFNFGVRSLAFQPDIGDNLLAAGSFDDSVTLFTITPQQALNEEFFKLDGEIIAIAGTGESSVLLAGRSGREIEVWEVTDEDANPVFSLSFETISAAFDPNGFYIALGGAGGDIHILDLESDEEVNMFMGSQSPVLALAYDDYGDRLFSSQCVEEIPDRDGITRCKHHDSLVWDPQTGEVKKDLIVDKASQSGQEGSAVEGHTDYVRSLAYLPFDNALATGSDDKTINIWGLEQGYPLTIPLSQHTSPVTSLVTDLSGLLYLAAGGQDQSLILWDAFALQPVGESLSGAFGSVLSLAFSSDASLLFSGDSSGKLLVWFVSPDEWIKRNCEQAGRNLSIDEWNQFVPEGDYRATCEQWPEGE